MIKVETSFSSYSRGMASCLKKVTPWNLFDASLCEALVQMGLFFDGTNNNKNRDEAELAHTNVARLSAAYDSDEKKGFFNVYVPGVGTSFPEIGETGESGLGGGFAIGCEARVLYAILELFNSLHKRIFKNDALFSKEQVKALCCNHLVPSIEDGEILARMGYSQNLLEQNMREHIFRHQLDRLEAKMKEQRQPKILECLIDVFGFSRGAAEARVFCNWLDRLLVGGKFAGVPLRIRFLGIFDAVASAGFWNGVASTVANSTDGHSGWATPESLRVPASVENCAHFLAMHELRKNFPLDEIGVDGVLAKGHVQLAYPGSHSDVGGGYAPGDLGIAVGKTSFEGDALKLSQVSLNHMFDCVVAAGVPLSKKLAKNEKTHYDPFAVSPLTIQAFNDFLRESGAKQRPLHQWMQPYLNWRWQVREVYEATLHVKRANEEDKKLLRQANRQLIKDAELLLGPGVAARAFEKSSSILSRIVRNTANGRSGLDSVRLGYMDDEAPQILSNARCAAPVSKVLTSFFDNYVHDSFAGFTKTLTESTGYWRYRKAFKGSRRVFFASNDEPDSDIA